MHRAQVTIQTKQGLSKHQEVGLPEEPSDNGLVACVARNKAEYERMADKKHLPKDLTGA